MRTLILVLAFCIASPLFAGTISREKCDELYDALREQDAWAERKDASALAWNESYVLHALEDLYEATGDTKYLDELVRRGDIVLSRRDDRRGFKDASGETHKRWSNATKYTVAEAVLNDPAGKPSIKLRSTPYGFNDSTRFEVKATDKTFTLHVVNRFWKRDETFADLSMDPASDRYFVKVINNPTPPWRCTPGGDGLSQLLKAQPIGEKPALPQSVKLTPITPLWHAHVGYVGVIYHPLLRFCLLIKSDPKLKSFTSAAERFTIAAEESYDEIKSFWRDGSKRGEGYYIGCERGGPAPFDNIGEALNYQGKLALSELALFQLTEKPQYKQHTAAIAQLFKNGLEHTSDDAYIWKYWYGQALTGWKPSDNVSDNYPQLAPIDMVEDSSHGTLEVELAVEAAKAGIVFDETDLKRFANTFLKRVLQSDRGGFNGRVDGSDEKSEYYDMGVHRWLILAGANEEIYRASRALYLKRDKDHFQGLASLLKWERKLGK